MSHPAKPLIRAAIPKPKVRGLVSLGPKPGTPEFALEQRCKASGVPYCPPDALGRDDMLDALGPDTQRSGS